MGAVAAVEVAFGVVAFIIADPVSGPASLAPWGALLSWPTVAAVIAAVGVVAFIIADPVSESNRHAVVWIPGIPRVFPRAAWGAPLAASAFEVAAVEVAFGVVAFIIADPVSRPA